MSKPSPESIEKLLSAIPDDDLRTIVKAYALTHPTMYDALSKNQKEQEPEKAVFDYASAVKRCYRHIMKTPRWGSNWHRQPDYLDWEEVGKDLRGVIRRAEGAIAAGRPDIAVETAFLILEIDDRQYEEEFLSEREDWDADDLCLDACFTLMEEALDSPLLSKEQKLDVCERIEGFFRSELMEYVEYDVDGLIESVRGSLLTEDEHLAVMMQNYRRETGWRASSMACDIWDYLIRLGRTDDAEAFFHENRQVDALRLKYMEYLQSAGRYDEVLTTVNEGIKLSQDQRLPGLTRQWRERKLQVLENSGRSSEAASVCLELFADAHSSDVLKYYLKAKEIVSPDTWAAFRDRMLEKNRGLQTNADSPLAEIYLREGLIDRLYAHLLGARFNLLPALSRYAKAFTPEHQRNLVSRLEKEFPIAVGYQSNRKSYAALAGRLNMLAGTCPAGKELASRVVTGFRSKFPNRPALLEELANVKL